MRIGFNAPSMQAYNALARSDKSMVSSSARLSTGAKITTSSDNSAGMAISTNMRLQIDALNRAEQNSANAISLLQTAESGLGEIQSILQRIRELGVQAANDTNSDDDRALIQTEIDQLLNEIIDMTNKSEYNQTKLLGGGSNGDLKLTFHTGANKDYNMKVNLPEISCETLGLFTKELDPATAAEYELIAEEYATATEPYDEATAVFDEATRNYEALNLFYDAAYEAWNAANEAYPVAADAYTDAQIAYEAAKAAREAATTAADISKTTNALNSATADLKTATEKFEMAEATLEASAKQLAEQIAKPIAVESATQYAEASTTPYDGSGYLDEVRYAEEYAANYNLNYQSYYDNAYADKYSAVKSNATGAYEAAKAEAQADYDAAKTVYEPFEEDYDTATKKYINDSYNKIPLDAVKNPSYVISRVEQALEKVSKHRAYLGAFVNRLEHTASYLSVSSTEASTSLSRILDTDVALEMSNFSRLQVLTQTATAIMSQANQLPQSVLQLLQ